MYFYSLSNTALNIIEKTYNFLIIYPDILLILVIMILISYLVILDFLLKNLFIIINIAKNLILISLFYCSIIILNNYTYTLKGFNSLLISDSFIIFIKIIIILSILSILLLSINYLREEKIYNYEYFIFYLLILLGLFMITSSYDLISLYLAIELQSLCFYILATLKNFTNFSSEAGIKYFILGAFSSGILLLGCSLIYGFTGLTDFYSFELLFQNKGISWEITYGITIGILLIITSLLFKIAAAPFHVWSPDVYEGAPTIITALFAIVPKIAILSIFIRIVNIFFIQDFYYTNQFILLSGLISLFIGTFSALYQVKIKRLLAYSAISHVGFLLIGISILSLESFYAVIFYILVYMLLSINVFSIILNLRKWNNNFKVKKINELVLLLKSNLSLGLILMITLFSLAGIPPLIGFYSKFYIFMSGIKSSYILIILIAALISVISSMYYIRLIKLIFFKYYKFAIFIKNLTYTTSLLISFTFYINFFFFFWPNFFLLYLFNIFFFFFF